MEKTIKENSKVKFHFKVQNEKKDIVENTYEDLNPIEFQMGKGVMLPSFEENLKGKKEGDTHNFFLSKEECYGQYNEDLILELDKEKIELDEGTEVGSHIRGQTPEGKDFNCILKKVKKDTLLLDFNHPLAGNSLYFSVEILNVEN
jgi:FKBP-type peptidyl-prolyl cis-trans isomerase SlpA